MMNLMWDDCWDSAGCGQFCRCLFYNCALCGECFSYHWRVSCYNTAGRWPLATSISSMNMGSILSSRSTLSTISITLFSPVGFLVHHKTVDWMSQTVDSSKHSTHPETYNNNNNRNVIKSTRRKMWHLQLPHSNSRFEWRGGCLMASLPGLRGVSANHSQLWFLDTASSCRYLIPNITMYVRVCIGCVFCPHQLRGKITCFCFVFLLN